MTICENVDVFSCRIDNTRALSKYRTLTKIIFSVIKLFDHDKQNHIKVGDNESVLEP